MEAREGGGLGVLRGPAQEAAGDGPRGSQEKINRGHLTITGKYLE